MVEVKVQQSVILFTSQKEAIQEFANEHYDGDLSQGLRMIVRLWMEKKRGKVDPHTTEITHMLLKEVGYEKCPYCQEDLNES